eukprot:scaffold4028_cov217-Alexandrium_tamarense.AAC.9
MRKATLLHSEYFAERSLENTVVLQITLCNPPTNGGRLQENAWTEKGLYRHESAAGTRPGFDYVDGDDLIKLKCIVLVSH